MKGTKDARIAIIAYSEFECPYCGRFARDTMPLIERDYVKTGKVLFVFRHLPLPTHKRAFGAAHAAECAGKQGRFWDMHDLLFQDQKALDSRGLRQRASVLSLNAKEFMECFQGQSGNTLSRDMREAQEFGVNSTPTFLFGVVSSTGVVVKGRLNGARPFPEFQAALNKALSALPKNDASASSPR